MEDLSKKINLISKNYRAVVLGVSAGGMEALTHLVRLFESPMTWSLIIVQHQHPHQDDFLVHHLNENCRLPVKEIQDKEDIKEGMVYLAPPDYHVLIEKDKIFSLSMDMKVNFSRPSIDVLFESAADAYGAELVGIILTGANGDGAIGLRRIKECRGLTIVQDPATAEYPTMPLEAMKVTAVDIVLPLDEIGQFLNKIGQPRISGMNRKDMVMT